MAGENYEADAVQAVGGCGAISPDGGRLCILEIGHGPHGWDNEPLLGLATTRQLLTELKVRGEVEACNYYEQEGNDMALGAAHLLDTLPGSMLAYRTVDS